jgi:hypothetical protein
MPFLTAESLIRRIVRVKQVEKLEAELKEKKAQMAREKRKERGGQLVALGIMVESVYSA